MENKYKSGYIAVIGKPNVGKSTLINRLLGEKLVIVTPRPQTTRNNIIGINTTKTHQLIFIDTPGIHKAKNLLGKHMVKQARASLQDADIILFIIEPFGITEEDKLIAELLKGIKKPVFLIINKADLINKDALLPVIDEAQKMHHFQEIIPISAMKGKNTDILKDKILDLIPYGPQYYSGDQLSDKQERFFVTEIIREQALRFLHEEIPHSVAVIIDEMKDRNPRLSYIKATIYVERDSQKLIIVGKNGQKIKQIGANSRKKLERFLGRKVYIELWVKLSKDWRKNPVFLKRLGY